MVKETDYLIVICSLHTPVAKNLENIAAIERFPDESSWERYHEYQRIGFCYYRAFAMREVLEKATKFPTSFGSLVRAHWW